MNCRGPFLVPLGRNRVFSLGVSQKYEKLRKMSVRSSFFSRSRLAWEAFFAKVALKALARGQFYFGGEWVLFLRILAFFLTFWWSPLTFCAFWSGSLMFFAHGCQLQVLARNGNMFCKLAELPGFCNHF